ncbi:SprT-like family protein [Flavobacteriaceae bacterium MAR_2010_188]|nr:SprT-like family protein [Flavobacteriaceae bacterium MAR_2010_188]
MQEAINSQIPEAAIAEITQLLSHDELVVKIKRKRKTKHGDYRLLPDGKHQITVNESLNKYRFLITLVHEIAHFEAFKKFGRKIKPHGKEWKSTFQRLMLPFINPEIFPNDVLPLLAKHFRNPKASSNSDEKLYLALKQFDPPSEKSFIFEVREGETFLAQNNKKYKMGKKRVKRFECLELENNRLWLFNPNAEVDVIGDAQLSSKKVG